MSGSVPAEQQTAAVSPTSPPTMPAPPIGALPVALRLRFLIVKCLLLFAAAFARVMRPLSKARRPPGGTVCLPKDDSDPAGRARETEQALSEYPLVSMSERFALDCPRWPHLTVPLLPPRERYPALMFIPKAAVRLALSVDLSTEARWASADAPRSLYWPLRAPEAAQTADDDARFVRWRLQGPNAGWLRRCSSPEAMRAEGASSATLARVAPRDSDLADLYVVNHHPLLNALPTLPGRHLAGAMAFFRREADGSLKPAGIQLTGCDGRVVFFSPDDGAAWKLARSWFQCADMHVHEAVSHFLWTHIVGEKFLLATARRLPWRHPVRRFLAPHFEFTLNANYNSGTALVGFNGIFERAFSAGWRGTGGLIQRADLIWHFDRMILPRQIAARDVAGIADYPCRDDALLIWNALEEHAAAYVDLWYPSDDAVRTDPEIRSWSEELHGWIGDRGFPAVEDRPTLRVVLAAVLFNDVQHTLVNALQYDAFAYPPAWPSSMWEPPPSGDISSSVAEGLLLSSLPPVRQTLEAIRATYAFSIQFNMLGRGLRRYHSGPSLALMDRLQDRLKEVTKVIEQRNAKRSHPYRIALPARVSNSINA